VIGYYEKVAAPPGNLANGAVYILSTELITRFLVSLREPRDFSADVLPLLVGRIYTLTTNDLFMDVGTPDAYARANIEW
jgi:mannose-1-phosphate guanylyltransferase